MSARIDEPNAKSTESGIPKRVTLRDLRRWRREGTVFPCLTAYDATMARWLSKAGVSVFLVGDSAAEVVLGLPSTTHAPLDFLLQITAAVRRGAPNAYVIGDMPFLSYPISSQQHALQLQALSMQGINPTSAIYLDTADTILGYVESGLGWSLIPSLDPEGPKTRRLVAYPWGKPRMTLPIVMAWRKDAPEHPMLDEMIRCAPLP